MNAEIPKPTSGAAPDGSETDPFVSQAAEHTDIPLWRRQVVEAREAEKAEQEQLDQYHAEVAARLDEQNAAEGTLAERLRASREREEVKSAEENARQLGKAEVFKAGENVPAPTGPINDLLKPRALPDTKPAIVDTRSVQDYPLTEQLSDDVDAGRRTGPDPTQHDPVALEISTKRDRAKEKESAEEDSPESVEARRLADADFIKTVANDVE